MESDKTQRDMEPARNNFRKITLDTYNDKRDIVAEIGDYLIVEYCLRKETLTN